MRLPTVASCAHHHSTVFVNSLDLRASWILTHPGPGCRPVEWDYSEAVGTWEIVKKKLGNWGVLWRVYQNPSPDSFCLLPVLQVKGITVGCIPCRDTLSLSQAQRQHGWLRILNPQKRWAKPDLSPVISGIFPQGHHVNAASQEGLPVNMSSLPNSHRKPY